MGAHALLSASSSHRWLACPPSARLEQQFRDETSVFAAEGTAAHSLAEHKLRKYLNIATDKPVCEYSSPELEEYTDVYVDFAYELITEARVRTRDAIVLIEQQLDFSYYVPGGFGTGDLVVVADGILDVVDLKFGKGVEVSAEHNPQLMLYSLGALALFDTLFDIQTVRMTICQPRLDNLSTFELPVDELINWAETELQPRAELAFKGDGIYTSGDHCRFCRAKQQCRARAEANLELARYDFRDPPLLTDAEVSEILTKAGQLSAWASDIWAYALEQAVNHGKQWDGFKVVEGRSNRRYSDEAKVVATVLSAGSYSEEELYTRSLIGITAMEKLLGKKQFNELLGGLVEKPPGKPALVVVTDKRPAINTAITDFN